MRTASTLRAYHPHADDVAVAILHLESRFCHQRLPADQLKASAGDTCKTLQTLAIRSDYENMIVNVPNGEGADAGLWKSSEIAEWTRIAHTA